MKIAIMQPYFFPYIGYFSLINYVDQFILFDTPQFIRHGWIERNRVLKPDEGWMYVKVPLEKHDRNTPIHEIRIRNSENWQEKILQQLMHYKRKAPFYNNVVELIEESFKEPTNSIVELNKMTLLMTCKYLGITTPISVLTEMNLVYEPAKEPDEWALNISLAMDADEYVNPIGGVNLFNKEKYALNGLKLSFLHVKMPKYDQKREPFEEGLSLLDLLMFNSVDKIRQYIDEYKLS